MSGTAAAAASLLTVMRTSSRAGVGERGDLERGGVGVGGVRVGHRLDDDRVRGADEHAADVDRRGLPAPGQMRQALDLDAVGSARVRRPPRRRDVEDRDDDEERHQEHEAGEVDSRSAPALMRVAGDGLDEGDRRRGRRPCGGRGRTLTTARLADRSADEPDEEDRGQLADDCPRRRRCRAGPATCGLARSATRSRTAAQDERRGLDGPLEAELRSPRAIARWTVSPYRELGPDTRARPAWPLAAAARSVTGDRPRRCRRRGGR